MVFSIVVLVCFIWFNSFTERLIEASMLFVVGAVIACHLRSHCGNLLYYNILRAIWRSGSKMRFCNVKDLNLLETLLITYSQTSILIKIYCSFI